MTVLNILTAIAELALIVWILAGIENRGYRKGHRDGYQEGHKAARETVEFFQSLDWWGVAEREVKQEREAIKHESGNQEGWP